MLSAVCVQRVNLLHVNNTNSVEFSAQLKPERQNTQMRRCATSKYTERLKQLGRGGKQFDCWGHSGFLNVSEGGDRAAADGRRGNKYIIGRKYTYIENMCLNVNWK